MRKIGLLLAMIVFLFSTFSWAEEKGGSKDGVARKICRVKLVSEVEPDMTSIDTILKAIIKPGMNDEQKCVAVMRFVTSHIFWGPSSAGRDFGVHDPIALLNCYVATICQQDAAVLCPALWTALGYDVRYWQLGGHVTSEVYYGGKWRNLDSTFNRIYRNSDGSVASVKEKNRMYKPEKSKVPPWDEFEIGHRMDINLRKGESLTRYWAPLSKDKDYWRPTSRGKAPRSNPEKRRSLGKKVKKKPYRIGSLSRAYANGVWLFEPDFSDADWKDIVYRQENIVAPKSKDGFLKPAPGKTGTLVLRVFTPYIITGGWLEAEFTRKGADSAAVSISNNNGCTWKEAWKGAQEGAEKIKLPLRKYKFAGGRFWYLVKIEMKGGSVGVKNIKLQTIVQVNPLSLPALKNGENIISFDIGEQTERVTFYPDTTEPEYREQIIEEKNIGYSRELGHEKWVRGLCVKKPLKEAYVIAKVTAPGDVKYANFGGWLSKKGVKLFYSFDGKNWKEKKPSYKYTYLKSESPNALIAYYENVSPLPPKTRTMYFKYTFWKEEPTELCQLWVGRSLRADLDYVPKGLGKFHGAKVTYCWVEETGGKQEEKQRSVAIKSVPRKFKVNVGGKEKPLMKWVKIEFGAK